MTGVDHTTFATFFRELWGHAPFPWQQALAERVLTTNGSWPEAVTVPTAAGKTACIDIAVFALAAMGGQGKAARRIWFVVDRRVIVDEAHARAHRLAARLAEAKNGLVAEVADRLRGLGQSGIPLTAHLLRGGIARDDSWARDPLQPIVLASTVDQFGSRLLFRAYGRSNRAWPIQAGLAGNDSLIFLDEAHCAQPFLETLRGVSRLRSLAESPIPTPFGVVILSATPPDECRDRHGLTATGEDLAHPVLGPRLTAKKPAYLADPVAGTGEKGEEAFAKALAQEARRVIDPDAGRMAVVVFANKVATARRVHAILERRPKEYDLVLLTGRMRPLDKDDTVAAWLSRLAAGAMRRLERPVIVVATQTLEVGANLDFDGLVTECASLDALRQRFGRLNRTGRDINARAVVLIKKSQAKQGNTDPVYGPALACTWQWLWTIKDKNGTVDFGITALDAVLPEKDILPLLNAPVRHAPVLLPSHLDALAQTDPAPTPSPDPGPFLHGSERGKADVQVAWRADLDPNHPEQWTEILALCPPSAAECLAVPFDRIRSWLDGGVPVDEGTDIEGDGDANPIQDQGTATPRTALRWFSRDEHEIVTGSGRVRPGDILIVPAQVGGLAELGYLPAGLPVDRGDQAFLLSRGKACLRLTRSTLATWPQSGPADRLAELVQTLPEHEEEGPDNEWFDEARTLLRNLASEPLPRSWSWLAVTAAALAEEQDISRNAVPHPGGGIILLGKKRLQPDVASDFTDENDTTASGTVRVELTDHLSRVSARAQRHGAACFLLGPLIEALAEAGRRHDLGKADPRFQAWLNGGRPPTGVLLAKSASLPQHPVATRQARDRAGYPAGGRHELLSVRMLEATGEDRDLVLHLVASHHGRCRPLAPVVDDHAPVAVRHPLQPEIEIKSDTMAARLDSAIAQRFWRLTRQYGWWGLAFLESLLRLADHLESAEEAR